jgi:hypothetical protein
MPPVQTKSLQAKGRWYYCFRAGGEVLLMDQPPRNAVLGRKRLAAVVFT